MPKATPTPAKAAPKKLSKRPKGLAADLQGASQLTIAGVRGIVSMVESLHNTITRGLPATGVSRLVYRSIHGITQLTGGALNTAFAAFAPLIDANASLPKAERAIALAALNGAFGDHLAQTGNPLAITMQLHHQGESVQLDREALSTRFPNPSGKLLVLVHGLCMNDAQWLREGHDHGAALRDALGYTPLYLRYNSGLPIANNGAQLADLLDRLQQQWPVEVSEMVLLTHSMGGLVARAACHFGEQARQPWFARVSKLIFLGTPHHGAPLERAGRWVDLLLGISAFSAPFARLGLARSAGIQDLRYGNVLAAGDPAKPRSPPLPAQVQCYAVAATKQARAATSINRHALPRQGDGLVTVASALGEHRDPALELGFKPTHRWIGYEMNHFDLLSRVDVFEQLRRWLA